MRVRSPLPLAGGCALIGLAVGAVVGLLVSPPYRATTTLLAKSHDAPVVVPTIGELAKSETVVHNVAQALHLSDGVVRSHLHVSTIPGTALVRVEYDDRDRVRAQQVAQQEASALESIAAARLPGVVTLNVVDPVTSARRPHRVFGFALWGALIGGLVGLAAEYGRRLRRHETPEPGSPPANQVPEREPEPEPEAPRESPFAGLRRGLAEHRDEFSPDHVAEWEAYLDAFEAQLVDGELPPSTARMAEDVFQPLQERLKQHEF
ncbi:MAG TPA: hypothetical protein VGQ38_04785 [Gaiellaceae bacterium]|nr:hypothetical protein [Gaiellaceae bacterium]